MTSANRKQRCLKLLMMSNNARCTDMDNICQPVEIKSLLNETNNKVQHNMQEDKVSSSPCRKSRSPRSTTRSPPFKQSRSPAPPCRKSRSSSSTFSSSSSDSSSSDSSSSG